MFVCFSVLSKIGSSNYVMSDLGRNFYAASQKTSVIH